MLHDYDFFFYDYDFFFVVEIIKIWSLSKFDAYNTMSLSIFTILCIRSPGFIYY